MNFDQLKFHSNDVKILYFKRIHSCTCIYKTWPIAYTLILIQTVICFS